MSIAKKKFGSKPIKKCLHSWKEIGYYDAGWGISTSCIIYWCMTCGSIKKNYKTIKPKANK